LPEQRGQPAARAVKPKNGLRASLITKQRITILKRAKNVHMGGKKQLRRSFIAIYGIFISRDLGQTNKKNGCFLQIKAFCENKKRTMLRWNR
jgi:hypothetical protein